ncbi:MAG: ferrous iron transporter B [candidate division WOR-3 bacterium]
MIKKILLFGNPNVGKSVIFTRLTGTTVIVSNYPGTTVEYHQGDTRLNNEKVKVIDVPGIYSLTEPTNPAEEVAKEMLEKAKEEGSFIVINVIDATNLERNLNLTLQLIKEKVPMIIALNLCDEARHLGIEIDYKKLSQILDLLIFPTCAITGEGIKNLKEKLDKAKISDFQFKEEERWQEIGRIIKEVQRISHRHHTFLERIEDFTIKPFTGLISAVIILFLTFLLVRLIGENLTNYLFDPLFNNLYLPNMIKLIEKIKSPLIFDILIGKEIEPLKSFGILNTGLYIPFVIVLPYLFAFYLILSILEDVGYLARLAIVFDGLGHRLGIHGYSLIPIILGFGCKVPAVMATRILERKKERILTTLLILLSSPCLPQTIMVIALLAPYGIKYLFLIFSLLIFLSLIATFILNRIFKGEVQEIFIEIPPYRLPYFSMVFRKLYFRTKLFIKEAVPLIIGGIFFFGILDILKIIEFLKYFSEPIFQRFLSLPKEVAAVMITGFLRKDVGIALLAPFNLAPKQLVIASIFLIIYLPCLSTTLILIREFKIKDALKIIIFQLLLGFLVSFILNILLS